MIQFASSEQYYHVTVGGGIKLIQPGPDLDALLHRELRICVELCDYACDPGDEYLHRHNVGDQTFFMVDISDQNHERSFRNIRKPLFVMRIQVYDAPNADPEPHFIAFILKGEHYYIYGGEERTRVYKLHKNRIADTLFDEVRRETFLETIGATWDHARYCIEGDFAGYGVVFLPKVILKNPSDMWDNRSINDIENFQMWEHPFIEIGEDIPETHNLAYSVVDLDDPEIIDIGDMLFH